jgi:shikimate kinase
LQTAQKNAQFIVLTGFMAAGKSTAGRALASLLGWRFVDLDCEIETRTGQSIPELFTRHGEERFRQIEAEILHAVLDSSDAPTVMALGGGTFAQAGNATLLREHRAQVVFLEVSTEELLRRCREVAVNGRPLVRDEESFSRLYAKRLPLYRTADLEIAAEGKFPEAIAQEICEKLNVGG